MISAVIGASGEISTLEQAEGSKKFGNADFALSTNCVLLERVDGLATRKGVSN